MDLYDYGGICWGAALPVAADYGDKIARRGFASIVTTSIRRDGNIAMRIWKLQRPLASNEPFPSIMAYTEGRQHIAMTPNTKLTKEGLL